MRSDEVKTIFDQQAWSYGGQWATTATNVIGSFSCAHEAVRSMSTHNGTSYGGSVNMLMRRVA